MAKHECFEYAQGSSGYSSITIISSSSITIISIIIIIIIIIMIIISSIVKMVVAALVWRLQARSTSGGNGIASQRLWNLGRDIFYMELTLVIKLYKYN